MCKLTYEAISGASTNDVPEDFSATNRSTKQHTFVQKLLDMRQQGALVVGGRYMSQQRDEFLRAMDSTFVANEQCVATYLASGNGHSRTVLKQSEKCECKLLPLSVILFRQPSH